MDVIKWNWLELISYFGWKRMWKRHLFNENTIHWSSGHIGISFFLSTQTQVLNVFTQPNSTAKWKRTDRRRLYIPSSYNRWSCRNCIAHRKERTNEMENHSANRNSVGLTKSFAHIADVNNSNVLLFTKTGHWLDHNGSQWINSFIILQNQIFTIFTEKKKNLNRCPSHRMSHSHIFAFLHPVESAQWNKWEKYCFVIRPFVLVDVLNTHISLIPMIVVNEEFQNCWAPIRENFPSNINNLVDLLHCDRLGELLHTKLLQIWSISYIVNHRFRVPQKSRPKTFQFGQSINHRRQITGDVSYTSNIQVHYSYLSQLR